MLAACIGVAASVWQSPHGDAARPLLAGLPPQLVTTASPPLENPGLAARPSPAAVQLAAAETAPARPASPAPTAAEEVAPPAAAPSGELLQLPKSMARDLAVL